MENCIAYQKMENARHKIEQMNQLKDAILNCALTSETIDTNCAFKLIDSINEIQIKSQYLLDNTQEMINEMVLNTEEIINHYIPQQSRRDMMIGDVVHGIGELSGGVLNDVNAMATGVVSMAEPLALGILGTTARTVATINESSKSIASDVIGITQNQANTIVDQVDRTSKAMCSSVGNVVGTITSTTSDVLKTVFKGNTSGLSTSTNNVLNGPGDGIANLTSTTTGIVKDLVSTGGNISQNMISSASILSKNILSSALTTIGDIGGSGIVGQASQLVENLVGNQSSDMIKTMFESGGTITSSFTGEVGGVLGQASQSLKSLTGNASNILNSSVGILGNVTNSIIGGDGSGGVTGLASGIVSGAAKVVSSMTENATNAIGNILNASTNISGNILNSVNGVTSAMLNTAKTVGGNLIGEVGKIASSDQSLIGGVIDLAGSTVGTASNLANSVLSNATNIASNVIGSVGDMASGLIDIASSSINSIFGNSDENGQTLAKNTAQQVQNITNAVGNTTQNLNPEAQTPEAPNKPNTNENNQQTNSTGNKSETNPLSNVVNTETKSKFNLKEKNETTFGWKGTKINFDSQVLALMRDGDQQVFNPYGHSAGLWTRYSFRPKDTLGEEKYPQIAITPSSFQALSSINTLLDEIPYVVIKEYFFKNTASTMINIVKKVLDKVEDKGKEQQLIIDQPSKEEGAASNPAEASSKGAEVSATEGKDVFNLIKNTFNNVSLGKMTIDIPYVLYCGLRKRMYGNTYVFPYIVNQSTIINQASNTSEWQKGAGGLLGAIKDVFSNIGGMIAGITATMSGSQARGATLFPAPTWGGPGEDKVSFSFDLMLINDHIVKARNNYMCVNTIINNNRNIQKAIFAFPGALYELWLPTGQRHLMCTGDFKLYPLGLNRQTPKGFFCGDVPGADFKIGTSLGYTGTNDAEQINPFLEGKQISEANEHKDEQEVIPDAYKLSMTFTSCLANNLNTSVFQYYCDALNSDPHAVGLGENDGTNPMELAAHFSGLLGTDDMQSALNEEPEERIRADILNISENDQQVVERFDESTYNKKLQKLRASLGDTSLTSDSAVLTIRKANDDIQQTKKFLSKLYNAENNNLWYKKFEKDEYYTTLNPDYSQALRKQYGDKLNELKGLEHEISLVRSEIQNSNDKLSRLTMSFDERQGLIEEKVEQNNKLNKLQATRTNLVDDMLKIDTQIISYSFDKHDDVVSIKKNEITNDIFKQVWNEKIMNSYEREKIKYMTSKEKTRYFQKKIRELKKFDTYHILNNRDWFFRVTVIDYIVEQMEELITLFKNCSYDDYETVYKVVRKLNLLELDLDDARNNENFNINKTNLFNLSEKSIFDYTKIDSLLNGSSLYDLFHSQINFEFIDQEHVSGETNEPLLSKDKEMLQEQLSEIDLDKRRSVRDEVVLRVWGSESELTRKAYELVNENPDKKFEHPITISVDGITKSFTTLREMKERIIQLKIDGKITNELQVLLGSFSNQVNVAKEGLIIQYIHDMGQHAESELSRMSDDVNAQVGTYSSQN